MILNLTQFAASSSGIGALGVDPKALIIQIITFLLAFWALQRWAFKPIVKLMRERRDTIEKGVELGQQMLKEKAELEAKVAEALQNARTEADGIITSAQQAARQKIQEAEDDARGKAQSIIDEAGERINQDTARAWRDVEKELASLVSEATETIIDEKLDAKKDSALIEKALKQRKATA